jgi:K+-transporting ATPase KdpF subunit
VVVLQARRDNRDAPMTFMELVGLVLTVGVAIYLFVALLYPEKFE